MEFRKVSLENLSRLSEMFKLCLNRHVDESYFVWKYKNNPAGEVIAFEAVEGDTIAAFYGVIPEIYLVNGQEFTVYQSMDTMTHPDFQKRGLFTKLANMTYEHIIQNRGVVHILGVPGSNSFYGFVNKLGWKNINNFKYIFYPRLFCSFRNLFSHSKKIEFELITDDKNEIIQYLEGETRIVNDLIQPKLDSKVFEWKVICHPFKQYQVVKIKIASNVVGVCICSIDDSGYIKIEYLEYSESNLNDLFKVLPKFLFKMNKNAQFIYAWEPITPILKEAYKKSGFLKNPFKKGLFSYKVPFITYSNAPEINNKNWFDINSFDIQAFVQD